MRLLILTQKVDSNDPVLGFFHRWIEEFAKHCEQITVIALGVGEYHLPANVRIFSLGKERGASRLTYIINFYRLIWRERKNYDVVFVHMNQEYVFLGGLLWKILGKKITMWRNHPQGTFLTRIAVFLSGKVFCTSPYSYTASYKKTNIMPVGIDTDIFFGNSTIKKKEHSILFLGRIAPIKNLEVLIDALIILDKKGVVFTAGVYGNSTANDREYYRKIRIQATDLEKKERIVFHESIAHNLTPSIYNQYELFVNMTPSGSFDKTIVEAMACGNVVITSNKAFKDILPEQFLFKEGDAVDLAEKLQGALSLPETIRTGYGKEFSQYVEQHSLSCLMDKLFAIFVEII